MNQSEAYVFNRNHLPVSLGVDDYKILQEIYKEYVKRLDVFIEKLDFNDLGDDELYMEVHTMKASSSSVGAQYLTTLIESIESELLAKRRPESDQNNLKGLRIAAIQTRDLIRAHADGLGE